MRYGLFNLTSGNLIDSVSTAQAALTMLAEMLEETEVDADALGLIVADEDGRTVTSLHGRPLAEWVDRGSETPAKIHRF